MQIYLVGGAVRDELLGLQAADRDWVVVGSTAAAMLAAGYLPVGKDFPVFLHPQTHEEYALARTERKIAAGYAGFRCYAAADVTLEQDLLRRDLTINAMARDKNGTLIDPYGGAADLRAGILRHVSPAFSEDPVRILRTARFAARYDFRVAPETAALMCDMVSNGEINALVTERVWQELAKGLMEQTPQKMFQVLRDCGALAVLLPEVDALFGVPQPAAFHPEIDAGIHTIMTLSYAAARRYTLPERYAALLHDLGKARTPTDLLPRHYGHDHAGLEPVRAVNQRWRVPKQCAELALLVCEYHMRMHSVAQLRPQTVLATLRQTDAFRRPERFVSLLRVCMADTRGRLDKGNTPYPQQDHWLALLAAAQDIDTAAIAQSCHAPQNIADAINKARLARITPLQKHYRHTHAGE